MSTAAGHVPGTPVEGEHEGSIPPTVPAEPVASPAVLRGPDGRLLAGSARPPRRHRGGVPGNLNAATNPWVSYWRRRALKPKDRWALRLVEDYVPSLVADLGGAEAVSFAQRKVAEVAAVSRVCWSLALAGGNLEAVARFITVETRALESLGLERKTREVGFLDGILADQAAHENANGNGSSPSPATPTVEPPGGTS